jgi:hypothetical protein
MTRPGTTLSTMSDAELQVLFNTAGQMAANEFSVPMGNFMDPQLTQDLKEAIIAEQLKRQGISTDGSDYLKAIADGGAFDMVDETETKYGRRDEPLYNNYLEAVEAGGGPELGKAQEDNDLDMPWFDAANGAASTGKAFAYKRAFGLDKSVKNGKMILTGTKAAKLDYWGTTATRMNKSTFFKKTAPGNIGSSFGLGMAYVAGGNGYNYLSGQSNTEEFITDMAFDTAVGYGFAYAGLTNPYALALGGSAAVMASWVFPEFTDPYKKAATQEVNYQLNEWTGGEYNKKTTGITKVNYLRALMKNPHAYRGIFY